MSVHQQIRNARNAKNWSMEQLAKAVSEREQLKKPLAWQTVQQWENGSSAPKRKRMSVVMEVLGISTDTPKVAEPSLAAERYSQAAGLGGATASLGPTLRALASIMRLHDEASRHAVANLVAEICKQPDHADLVIRGIVAMLDKPGNSTAQRYINSQAA